MSKAHVKRAEHLKEDDRILLKDLRILTVRGRPQNTGEDQVTVRYHELATKSTGEMVVATDQRVKVICEGWCIIDQELDKLL